LWTCRYSRAIRGVVSMAAAIKPADRTLNLVISVSPFGYRSQHILASALEMSRATGGLNEIFVYVRSLLREVSRGKYHKSGPRSSRAVARERAIGG
jgi:hypothetical protein